MPRSDWGHAPQTPQKPRPSQDGTVRLLAMLQELCIENLALFERAQIQFHLDKGALAHTVLKA